MERGINRWLQKEMLTTPDVLDPSKPLVVDEDHLVRPNPAFSYEAAAAQELERRPLGTSFVVFFHPHCNVHQVQTEEGEQARTLIRQGLQERLLEAIRQQFPDDPQWPRVRQEMMDAMQVALCEKAQPGFNNGEVYLWIRGLPLKEEFIVKVLLAFKQKVEDDPIQVSFGGQKYKALFYGWGFRYY